MPVKVSVIVPVYNPGPYIQDCVASILQQTLGSEHVEAILVDDGSTDDTPARLDRLAAVHPTVTVIHQENSGWPGKPRNVGIAAARGEYLFFLDNDDTLAPEALARLVAMADRNRSDVVLGRMAGFHRAVPKDLFYEDRDHASLQDTPLMEALTPHKLFRRSFVEEHGLRFPEGRRRLEDHPFVIRSYFLADNISVLSRYVCYYHIRRDDQSNAGLRRFDPVGYYQNLREGIGIIEEHTETGPFRDRLLSRFARAELLGRLRDRTFINHPADYRADLFREIKAVIEERIPTTVDPGLAPTHRIQMALVRAGRLDLVESFARDSVAVTGSATLHRVDRQGDGTLSIAFDATLASDDVPLQLDRDGAGRRLSVSPEIGVVVGEDVRRVASGPIGSARVVARRRDDWAELVGPAIEFGQDAATEPTRAAVSATTRLDLARLSAGDPIWPGTWDIFVRISALGHRRDVRLGAVRDASVPAAFRPVRVRGAGPLQARPYWTNPGDNLSLRVDTDATRRLYRRVLSAVRRRLRTGTSHGA